MKENLPKLIVNKFEGTNIDWYKFWSQFETGIDHTDVITVSKFSYLKELVVPKVRALTDGLPFNTEWYERARTILKARFGKPSEVANLRIQCITSLPAITQTSFGKIHNFNKKLATQTKGNKWLR